MATDIDKFVHDQLSVWPAVAAKYRALKTARTRQLPLGGLLVTLQSNPGRLPIFDHGCPLCEENYLEKQHSLPFEGRKGRKYNILVNRAPIFPNHLVITRDIHTPQTIWHRFPDMLDLALALDNYIVFYNSPNSGTSVPGHAHFQACPKGYMPLERAADRILRDPKEPEVEFLDSVRDAELYHYKKFGRGIFMLRARTSKSMSKMFYRLLDCMNLFAEESEPRFNAFAWCSEGEYRAFVTLRGASRPHYYYDGTFAISPGAADMAGFVVVPREEDFDRLDATVLGQIFDEVSLPEADEKRLLWRLVRTQPKIEVGIASGKEISFEIISDGAGPQKVSYREGKIDYNGVLYDSLLFEAPTISTLFAEPSFILFEADGEFRYAGALRFVVAGGKVQAVNIIGLEDYIVGVLSVCGGESPREAAVRVRTETVRSLKETSEHDAPSDRHISGTPSLVTWLEMADPSEIHLHHEAHPDYNVSAREQNRPYRGILDVDAREIRAAVDETWGETL